MLRRVWVWPKTTSNLQIDWEHYRLLFIPSDWLGVYSTRNTFLVILIHSSLFGHLDSVILISLTKVSGKSRVKNLQFQKKNLQFPVFLLIWSFSSSFDSVLLMLYIAFELHYFIIFSFVCLFVSFIVCLFSSKLSYLGNYLRQYS